MRRAAVLVAAFAIPVVSVFGGVLFRGEQFGYRDAAHFYYPLHKRTIEQWKSGRVPLWDPGDNGGTPLIGNPTAAVLYPAKLAFAALPYPWAARLYIVGHVGLAFASMVLLARGLGLSVTAAALAAMSYAFGGPVLFQYCNAIYLVGAAWLPLGLLAGDGWLRRGHARSLAVLAFVLAMQCLGGDIQVAYLMGVSLAAYALWIASVAGSRVPRPGIWNSRGWKILAGIALWIAGVLILASWLPAMQDWPIPASVLTWLGRGAKIGLWFALAWLLLRPLRGRFTDLGRGWAGLVFAAIVGGAVAAVQILPTAELASQSFRMAQENRMDIYGFSLEPYRLIELLWPGFFGVEFPENRLWLLAIPPINAHALWVASLYVGGLTIVLAAAALAGRDAPAWRGPVVALTVAAALLSMGRFGGPLWWGRFVPSIAEWVGPHGRSGATLFRGEDRLVRDAFGTPYWLFATLCPGFSGFRFPPKLLVFGSLGLSLLAGLGWDRLRSGGAARAIRTARSLVVLGLLAALLLVLLRGPWLSWCARSAKVPSIAGPVDAAGAFREIARALAHGMFFAVIAGGLAIASTRGKCWAGPVAVLVLAIDLGIANARIVWTVPQSEFDRTPRAAQVIRDSERRDPLPGPFRINRLPEWHPITWIRTRSPDRLREVVAWERDTLQSGHGMLYGQSYVLTPGVMEPEAYLDLFQPWTIPLDTAGARLLGLKTDQPIRYYPRRAFDLWGARYFIVPIVADDWLDPNRAIASFLPNATLLLPEAATRDTPSLEKRWREDQDWQLLRNPSAFPRAWIVHDVRVHPPGLSTDDPRRLGIKRDLTYEADPLWMIPGRPVVDLRRMAWVEGDDSTPRLDGADPTADEVVSVNSEAADRVELTANLDRDGFVVLADAYYPGWTLTVDGRPATIRKANLTMRGAFVPAGRHTLRFAYEPRSFRIGLIVSGLGLLGLIALMFIPHRPPSRG